MALVRGHDFRSCAVRVWRVMKWAEQYKRDVVIMKVATESPCIPLTTVGKFFGITRQGVSLVLRNNGINKINASTARRIRDRRQCDDCGNLVTRESKSGRCEECRGRTILVECRTCGDQIERKQGELLRRRRHPLSKGNFYCGRTCFYRRRR